ncbi:MAG: AAA family ATPase, partial [Spirochaetes bacterium]|nr:AAA family ATPase [Spirochaetota bacterium]
TFGYMSPEATGIVNKKIDERGDFYSLGVIFYRMLTGELPFKAQEINKLLHQQVAVVPLKPGMVKVGIPCILENIVMKLLYKDPELRYQSAKGLLYDLQRCKKGELDFIIGERDQKVKISYQTRLIGREKEINRLKKIFNKAKNNQGSICLVSGEPGIGKTRLIEEIQSYVFEQKGILIGARCLHHENKTPYQPFKDIINGYIRYVERLEKKEREKEIRRIKEVVGDLGKIIINLNGNIRGILGEVTDLVPLDSDREKVRFLIGASNFFCHLCKKSSVCVLYLDNLQWADEGSLHLFNEILSIIDNSNLLLIGIYRDNEISEEHNLNSIKKKAKDEKYAFDEIKLSSFNDEMMKRLIAELLGEQEKKIERLAKY